MEIQETRGRIPQKIITNGGRERVEKLFEMKGHPTLVHYKSEVKAIQHPMVFDLFRDILKKSINLQNPINLPSLMCIDDSLSLSRKIKTLGSNKANTESSV